MDWFDSHASICGAARGLLAVLMHTSSATPVSLAQLGRALRRSGTDVAHHELGVSCIGGPKISRNWSLTLDSLVFCIVSHHRVLYSE